MVEPNTLKQAKDIIAYLKEQNEKDSFATKLSDRFQKNRTSTNSQHTASCISCENIQNKTKVLLNEYVPKTIPFTNCTQDKNTANKNEEIKDIISFLKAKKEQNLVDETITNHDNLRNDPDTTNFTNSYMKNEDINVLINSGAIVKKHNPNYLQKKNNKRFKISHNNDKKQPGLKQFYHIVKSARSCQSNSLEFCEYNSKPFALHSTSITSKSKDRNFSNNFKESEKSLRVMPVEKANKLFSFQSSPKSNETKLWDIFCKIKRSNETVRKQPQQFNKDNKSTITLDDFCNNVVTISNDKLEKENANSKASEDMGNIFLKSFSTGNITSEKEKYKDTNSVPLTNSEIKNVKEKLENSTKTFDEVIERILKKINNGGNSSPKDELEQSINEERIIQYNDYNRKSDIINSQWHTIDFSADNNENVSLSAKYSIPEYNRDSDLHKYLMKDVDNKKSEVINKVNDSNFSGILGKHHMTGVESLIKEQKSCGDRIDSFNKEKISLKSFNNGKIIMKKENYKNIDSVTNLGEINNVENKLEKSIKEKAIVRTLIQRSGSNKNSQTLQCKEKSRNLNILVTESLVKNNKGNNLSSETNLVEYHEDCDLQKYSMRDYFNNFSQDIEIYYSQFTQKCAGSEKNENLNQINELDLVLKKEHDSKEVKVDFVNHKEQSIKEFYKCEDTNCSQNKTNVENSLETQIDLLEDERKKSILMATYKRQMENTKENEGNSKINKPFKLEDFLKNLVSSTEKKECEKNVPCKNKSYVKRYRKGKTKIYKLKKLKKKCLEGDTEDMNEDVSLQDLLKKLSSDNCGTISRMSRFRSGSSISTSSSYITDDSKSEILSTGSKELTLPQQRLRHGFNELSKDKSLCYARKELDEVPEHDKEDIKIKIQDIFFQILDDFKNKRTSFFKHRKQSFDNCIFKDGRLQFKPVAESSMTVISSQAQRSKAKFQLMLYIMKKIQTLLENDTKLTKRELYYQLKELISDQRLSDRAINEISCLLDVGMWTLNIIAQKGLVFGDLKLVLSSGEMLNCNIPGTLIPQDINDIVEVHSAAYFILVVEKESIFHKLIEEDLPNKLTRPFIMITGKGFPDLNTQLFLKKLWMVMSIPVFILVDADPHGINIMLNYRFGSVNNAHASQYLAVPNAKWLGVYPSEVINLNIAKQPLTEREIKLVGHISRTPYMQFSPKLVEELEVMSTKKFKASIEGLIKTDSYLSEVYLPNKFFTHNFI